MNDHSSSDRSKYLKAFIYLLIIFLITCFFLVSLELIELSFLYLGSDTINKLMYAISNPAVALFIGILFTALIQSSSVTTSMLVAIIATGVLPLNEAVYIVIGANIGNTVTGTIVAMGYIYQKKELKKALSTGTAHDFFNILTAAILFPLEYYFNLLSEVARYITALLPNAGHTIGNSSTLINIFVKPLAFWVFEVFDKNSVFTFFLGLLMLFLVLRSFVLLLKNLITSDSKRSLTHFISHNPYKVLFWGIGITTVIQSCSAVTSLTVPLVAKNKISLKRAFPFIMGANLGSTFTALIAAISRTDVAISLAFTHILFNLIGIMIFFPFPILRDVPLLLSRQLGRLTTKHRVFGYLYLLLLFFILPFILIYCTRKETLQYRYLYKSVNLSTRKISYYSIISEKGDHGKERHIVYRAERDSINNTKKISFIANLSNESDSIYIDQVVLFNGNVSDCINFTNNLKTGRICLTNIYEDFKLPGGLSFDSVLVYKRDYNDNKTQGENIYLSLKEPLIIRKEYLDEMGNPVIIETLTHVNPL